MPILNAPIGPHGPVIDIFVGISKKREELLQAKGLTIPPRVSIKALIDSGATSTCIDLRVIRSLGISPTDVTFINTPSTSTSPHACNCFDVSIEIPCGKVTGRIKNLRVLEVDLDHSPFDGLIGQDILSKSLFVYDGRGGTLTLAT